MAILITCGFALLIALWLASEPLRVAWRRGRLRRQVFPEAWRQILRRRVPYFARMPADLQLQLKRHILVFLGEKNFVGCAGQEITDEIRVTVAAQACMLLLNRATDYFPKLTQILVYPSAFIVKRSKSDIAGITHESRDVLAGESWSQDRVILSWDDTLNDAANPADGRNVVIHEFAHQLDQEKGEATGVPYLRGTADYRRWASVFGLAFVILQGQVQTEQTTLINAYGATDPAEFFAVASETFFAQPLALQAEHSDLYQELSGYYHVNPLSW